MVLLTAVIGTALAQEIRVASSAELNAAGTAVRPGTVILIEPGVYSERFHFTNLRGEKERPIVIAGADPKNPPRFEKGGMQLSNPAFIELRDLQFTQVPTNGLNIDDGNSGSESAHHITVRRVQVSEIGPKGNCDGIKLSGLNDFLVEECQIERWGDGGSGIDMVGCHRGILRHNRLKHDNNEAASGIQCKGGSTDLVLRRNRFENAGARAVNIGGSTGLQYFRPALKEGEEHAEARNIVVEGNTFAGSQSPIAFVGVDGAVVRFNTFVQPRKWLLRILQETKAPGFVPCRKGEFSHNLILFESSTWSSGGVNIGPGTAPETFRFAGNHWFCQDHPDRSKPQLPTEETDGVYGRENVQAAEVGAEALPES